MKNIIELLEEQITEVREMKKYYEFDSDQFNWLTNAEKDYYSSMEDLLDVYRRSKWVRDDFNKIQNESINTDDSEPCESDCCEPDEWADKEESEKSESYHKQTLADKIWFDILGLEEKAVKEESDKKNKVFVGELAEILAHLFPNGEK